MMANARLGKPHRAPSRAIFPRLSPKTAVGRPIGATPAIPASAPDVFTFPRML